MRFLPWYPPLPCLLASALLLPATSEALINPRFTPVNLVQGSQTILALEVGAVGKAAPLPAKVTQTLKGAAPASLTLHLQGDAAFSAEVQKAIGLGPAEVLVFLGDFSAAKDNEENNLKPVGALHAGTRWFGLFRASDGAFNIGPDPLDLQTVWAGGNEMLTRCVRYILKDNWADVPVTAGTRWGREVQVDKVSGKLLAIRAMATAANMTYLQLQFESGSRLFRFEKDGSPVLVDPGSDAALQIEKITTASAASPAKLMADFDGDGRPDLVEAQPALLLFAKGQGPKQFAAPQPAARFQALDLVTSLNACDFDGDGRLDLFITGRGEAVALRNVGQGAFAAAMGDTGEIVYNLRANTMAALPFEANNDGRPDLALLYASQAPQFFFNRGFFCFGLSAELDITGAGAKGDNAEVLAGGGPDLRCGEDLAAGQLGGATADFNGDGAQDLALVSKSGQVWLLLGEAEENPRLSLAVCLPQSASAPANVIAYDGERCLGARLAAPGQPAFFGKRDPGPLQLEWISPDSNKHRKTVEIEKPARLELGKW